MGIAVATPAEALAAIKATTTGLMPGLTPAAKALLVVGDIAVDITHSHEL